MEISVKHFKDLIQDEFLKFHSLLDRRQEALTSKIDDYFCTQNQSKNLNLVKIENSPEPSTIDSAPLSQLSVLQFIAEDKPEIVDKKPKIFEIKFQLYKEPVEKEIEQCGEIKIEQVIEPQSPIWQRPEEIDFSEVPSPVREACSFIKKEKDLPMPFNIKREFCDCEEEMERPVKTELQSKSNISDPGTPKVVRSKSVEKKDGPDYNVIMKLINGELLKGDIWCLVDCDWFRQWRLYSNADKTRNTKSMHPGPINNSRLINSTGLLRDKLVHNIDYKLVPIAAWMRLEKAYGVTGPTIRRWVVEYGNFIKRLRVEIYPLALNCQIEREGDTTEKVIYMSRVANFQNLETQIRLTLKLSPENSMKISYKSHIKNWIELNDGSLTPQILDFYEGQQIMVKITQKSENRLKNSRKGSIIDTNMEKKRKKTH